MTVAELESKMGWAEYLDWQDYYRERHHQADLQAARARGEIRTDDPNAAKALIAASGAVSRKRPKRPDGPAPAGTQSPGPRTMTGPAAVTGPAAAPGRTHG